MRCLYQSGRCNIHYHFSNRVHTTISPSFISGRSFSFKPFRLSPYRSANPLTDSGCGFALLFSRRSLSQTAAVPPSLLHFSDDALEAWQRPGALEQRWRSILVQLLLLSSPLQPVTLSQVWKLFQEENTGEQEWSAADLRRLDPVMLDYFGKARTAVLIYLHALPSSSASTSTTRTAHGVPEHEQHIAGSLPPLPPHSASAADEKTLRRIGKRYVTWYEQSVLPYLRGVAENTGQTEGRTSPEVPAVYEVGKWITIGLLVSDPYFHLRPCRGSTCSAVRTPEAPPLPQDEAVLYPLPPSRLLFAWELEAFWTRAKWRMKNPPLPPQSSSPRRPRATEETLLSTGTVRASRVGVVQLPVDRVEALLKKRETPHRSRGEAPPVRHTREEIPESTSSIRSSRRWTLWHSLYYLTQSPLLSVSFTHGMRSETEDAWSPLFSVLNVQREGKHHREVPCSLTAKETQEKEWAALWETWWETVDPNLPDNLGDVTLQLDEELRNCAMDRKEGGAPSAPRATSSSGVAAESATSRLYRELPHVGFREYRVGSPAFCKRFGPASPSPSHSFDADAASPFHSKNPSSLASSSSSGGGGGASSSSTCSALRGVVQHLWRQHYLLQASSPAGVGSAGFYHSLRKVNSMIVGELASSMWLAPLSISRLASLLHWHGKEGEAAFPEASFFYQHSLLYLLLWLGGHPMLLRMWESEVLAARSIQLVHTAFEGGEPTAAAVAGDPRHPFTAPTNPSSHQCSRTNSMPTTSSTASSPAFTLPRMSHCWDYDPPSRSSKALETKARGGSGGVGDGGNVVAPPRRRSEKFLFEEEQRYLQRWWEHGTRRFAQPIALEPLAFFLRLPCPPLSRSGSPSASTSWMLMDVVRGVPLHSIRVLNTYEYTPMELRAALAHLLLGSRTGREEKLEVVEEWAQVEPHLYAVPFSLLKRRLMAVAVAWATHAESWVEHPRTTSTAREERSLGSPLRFQQAGEDIIPHPHRRRYPVLSVRQWSQALLWDLEFGVPHGCPTRDGVPHRSGEISPKDISSVGCEMLWALLELADPAEEHFRLLPPLSQESTNNVGDWRVVIIV